MSASMLISKRCKSDNPGEWHSKELNQGCLCDTANTHSYNKKKAYKMWGEVPAPGNAPGSSYRIVCQSS